MGTYARSGEAVEGYARAMRPVMMVPMAVFLALGLGAAWVEYSQHSGLMRAAALSDVAQLCADLGTARACPEELRFRTRAANDPWSRAYHCSRTIRGLLIYTLGADNQRGGGGRDADLACSTVYSDADSDEAEPCACYVGDEASSLLK